MEWSLEAFKAGPSGSQEELNCVQRPHQPHTPLLWAQLQATKHLSPCHRSSQVGRAHKIPKDWQACFMVVDHKWKGLHFCYTHTHTMCVYVHKHARVCMCTFAQACAPFSTCMVYSCSSQNQIEGEPLQYRQGVQDPEKLRGWPAA